MKRAYLGDSYDAVKRFWQQLFASTAPLFAEPRFIPAELRPDFMQLTGIPILPAHPPTAFSILNDPDTGIRLPGEDNQSESRTHISISTIIEQLQQRQPRCIIRATIATVISDAMNSGSPRCVHWQMLALQHCTTSRTHRFYLLFPLSTRSSRLTSSLRAEAFHRTVLRQSTVTPNQTSEVVRQ
jgi:hypothetical protein